MEESCSNSSSSNSRNKFQQELDKNEEDKGVDNKRIKLDEKSSKVYSCPLCVYHCTKRNLMSQHINRHKGATLPDSTKKLTPKNCIVTDPVKIAALKETTPKVYPFPCPHSDCDKEYYDKKHLNAHVEAKHSQKFKYCCTVCGRLEYGRGYMRFHYSRNHPNDNYNMEKCEKLMTELYTRAEATGEKVEQVTYPCNVEDCDKVCEFPYQLAVHLKSHDVSTRTCTYCFKIFPSVYDCEKHIARLHNSALKTFKCHLDGCNESFFDERLLLRHQEYSIIHNPAKLSCDTCHRRFHWPESLQNHTKVDFCEPRSEPKFHCSTCSKGFYRKRNLDKHEQRHRDGTLNLKIPGTKTIEKYRKIIKECNDAIHIEKCNTNKILDESKNGKAHLMFVPCGSPNCEKKSVMFTTAPSPFHHLRMLLYHMICGRACTNLHNHWDEDGDDHYPDAGGACFVGCGNSGYEMQIVKKMVVKMAKNETPVTVTNFTEYEPYHVYDTSSLNEIADIMIKYNLTSKTQAEIVSAMESHLSTLLKDGQSTVRGHPPLIFDDEFHFRVDEKNSEVMTQLQMELDDELSDDDQPMKEDDELVEDNITC